MAKTASIHAFRIFFPAAALLAALAVPLSVWAMVSGSGWPPGLLGAGHGHELIFGFALALIAGYTLGPQPAPRLYALLGLWLAARSSWLLAPESWAAMLLSPAFALALAWLVVPRFTAAKKWRNKTLAPLILVLCLVSLVWLLNDLRPVYLGTVIPDGPGEKNRLLHFGILCLLLLMTFIGGRIIAPAAAGSLEKKGIELKARVQPRLEAALILLLASAALLSLLRGLPLLPAAELAGVCLLAAGLLIAIRCLRWKLWLNPERPDLLAFGLGYLWLAAGAIATATALLRGSELTVSLHLITVGALGTLSTSVMLRLHFQRAARRPPPAVWVGGLTTLILVAAVSRYLAGATPLAHSGWLWLSACCWSLAYLSVATLLLWPRHTD